MADEDIALLLLVLRRGNVVHRLRVVAGGDGRAIMGLAGAAVSEPAAVLAGKAMPRLAVLGIVWQKADEPIAGKSVVGASLVFVVLQERLPFGEERA
jgi:hypothetical protein